MVKLKALKLRKRKFGLEDLRGFLRRKIEKVSKTVARYPPFFIREPKYFITLPTFKRMVDVDIKYPLLEPLAHAHIKWVSKEKKLIYYVVEPELSPEEKKILKKIEDDLTETIDIKISITKNESEAMQYLQKKVKQILEETGRVLSSERYVKIMYYIMRDFVGLNEIEPLMHDPYIEDIGCSGLNSAIYIIHRKFGSIETNIIYKDFEYLSNFVVKMSERCGRYISYAKPLLDGSLPDGSRIQASLAKDVTTKGPTFCIKEGFLQFTDGNLKPISIFFEESKDNSKPELIEGTEILKPKNRHVVGVYPKLEQKPAKIMTVMKLPPPQKLVDIFLEDGKKITVTTNHNFHTFTATNLKLVEAKDLKHGMYIPVPIGIKAKGKPQKIDLPDLIQNYPSHVCFRIDNSINKVIKNFVKKYSNKKGIDRKELSKKFSVGNSYFYDILNGKTKSISAKLFLEICKEMKEHIKGKVKLILKTEKGYGNGKEINIPDKVDANLAYIVGLLISDGQLTKDYISIRLYDEKGEIVLKIADYLKELFGNLKVYGSGLYVCNKFLSWYINKVFGIPFGAKARLVKVPEIILKSPNRIIAAFLRGLFDGDGSSVKSLYYRTYSKDLAYALPFLLARFDIYSIIREEAEGYRILIPAAYEKVFFEKIGFHVKKKQKLLKMHIEKRKNEIFRKCGRMPNFILPILRKSNIKAFTASRELKITSSKFYKPTITKTLAKRTLDFIEKYDGNIKGLEYLKWLCTSKNEFVKIKKVRVYDNIEKAPVYDIELNPTNFFIGGLNGPLNLFDSIRKFRENPFSPVDIINLKTAPAGLMAYLWFLLEHDVSIMVCGGVSTGKTSFLNVLSMFIAPEEKIISIEDSVTGDSKILFKNGSSISCEKIGDLFKRMSCDKNNTLRNPRIRILTIDQNYKTKWVRPSSFIKHQVSKDMFAVKTRTGREIKVTEDHSLYSLREGCLKQIKPASLRKGDFIAVPRIIPLEGSIKNVNLLEHLDAFKNDFLVGEGVKRMLSRLDCTDVKPSISLPTFNLWKRKGMIRIDILKRFAKLRKIDMKELDASKLKIRNKANAQIPVNLSLSPEFIRFVGLWIGDGSYDTFNRNRVIVSNSDHECINLIRKIAKKFNVKISLMNDKVSMSLNSTLLYKLMKYALKIEGHSATKKIPDFILNLDNSLRRDFLKGYFSADGTVKKYEVCCCSQSSELLNGIQTILLSLNIISRIGKKRADKCYELSVSHAKNLSKFCGIGFLQARKNKKLNIISSSLAWHDHSDIIPLDDFLAQKINSLHKLCWPYMQGMQNIGREYISKIAEKDSPNPGIIKRLANSDIYWDKISNIKKLKKEKTDVYDFSVQGHEKFICSNILVHNTREINLPHENWIPSVTRPGFGFPEAGGKMYGEIDLFQLLRESFRQNPDYVIVGEVRGKEAYVMFQGMSSGHPSLGTIHAGSVEDVIKRLETPPIELSPSLIESLDLLIVMVNAKEKGKSARRIKEVVEIQSIDPQTGKAHTIKTFTWVPATDDFKENVAESEILRRISIERGLSYPDIVKELDKRKKVLEWMQRHDVVQFDEVCSLINLYYKDQKTIMDWVRRNLPPYKTKTKEAIEKIWKSATGLKVIK